MLPARGLAKHAAQRPSSPGAKMADAGRRKLAAIRGPYAQTMLYATELELVNER
jgi:hypothetical protein